MATTAKSHYPTFTVPAEKKQAEISTTTSEFWKMAEFNRFGIIPMLLIFLVCLSGIAAGFGAPGDAFQLTVVAIPTAVALALVLAVAPMRWIAASTAIAVVLDLLILLV